jgi:hypothetical protein
MNDKTTSSMIATTTGRATKGDALRVRTNVRAGGIITSIEGGTWKADKADTKMGTDFLA